MQELLYLSAVKTEGKRNVVCWEQSRVSLLYHVPSAGLNTMSVIPGLGEFMAKTREDDSLHVTLWEDITV